MNIFKQAVGIDVSMDSIDVRYGYIDFNQNSTLTPSKSFKNSSEGHKKFLKLPNKIRNYAKSLEAKSKTDPIDSAAVTRFALERKQTLWTPPDPKIRAIRDLAREYHSLKVMATEVKNQIHAKENSFSFNKDPIKRK